MTKTATKKTHKYILVDTIHSMTNIIQ